MRYNLSEDERDLETSILQFTHAILLPFPSPLSRDIISTFFLLTQALFYRALKSKLPRDVACCLKYLHYMQNPSFERLGIAHNKVITFLVYLLALQMGLEPRNAMQCLEEMAVLCSKQLSLNLFGPELNSAVEIFSRVVLICIPYLSGPPSQLIIECLREANARLPDSPYIPIALSRTFHLRFYLTQSDEDYEGAMAPLDNFITSHSPAESPNQYLTDVLYVAADIAYSGFIVYGTPEHLEEAISRTHAHLISTSPEDPERGDIVRSLEELKMRRLNDFGITHALLEAHSSNPETICLPPFSHLTASLIEMNAMESPSMAMEDCLQHLEAFNSMNRIADRKDIDEAIKYCQLLLASLQQSPVHPVTMTDMIIAKSCHFLHHVFTLTNNPKYLDELIDVRRKILKTSHAQWTQFLVIQLQSHTLYPLYLTPGLSVA